MSRGRLTSFQMDMTRTMGRVRASLSLGKPPTSSKRLNSPKTVCWLEQYSGVISAVSEMPYMPRVRPTGQA